MIDVAVMRDEKCEVEAPVADDPLERFVSKQLTAYGIQDGEVNIVYVADDTMTELNEAYKGRTGATDVLSFDLSDDDDDSFMRGEIYISLPRARSQSVEASVGFDEEVVRLAVHGFLHLAGYTHDTDERYERMMEETDKLVREFFSGGGPA